MKVMVSSMILLTLLAVPCPNFFYFVITNIGPREFVIYLNDKKEEKNEFVIYLNHTRFKKLI
jgi:hypothetical protein